jgi:hypothetical protein
MTPLANRPIGDHRHREWAIGAAERQGSPSGDPIRVEFSASADFSEPPSVGLLEWRNSILPLLTGRIARRIDHVFGSVTSAFWQHQAFRARRPTAVDTLVPGRLAFAGAVAGWVHP